MMTLKRKRLLRRLLRNPSWLERDAFSGAALSMDPPIVLTTFAYPDPTAQMRAVASRLGRRQAIMVLVMSWIFEAGEGAAVAVQELRRFRAAYPRIDVVITCSEPSEIALFNSMGEEAVLVSLNAFVSERFFYPLASVEVGFDAIYNTRLSAQKRVDLASDIDSVAYITRLLGDELKSPEGLAIMEMIAAREPQHRILNERSDGGFKHMPAADVNRACNRAAVGLCLSPKEGAMLSSMEYMLAGLPIVSVPNVGGRNLFFDADYWIEAAPESKSVRNAVIELRDRNIPRDVIRAKTLQKLAPHRQRFTDLLGNRLQAAGFAPRYAGAWPWPHYRDFFQWRSVQRHIADGQQEDRRRTG